MTGLERIGAALSGSFADRRAAAPVLSLYGSRLSGASVERHYRDAAAYAAGQRAVADRFGPDVLFGPFALALEAEAYGARLSWSAAGPPNVRRPVSAGAAPSPAAPEGAAGLGYLVESVRATAEAAAGQKPVAAPLCAPTDLPALVFGIESWLETLLFDPPAAAGLLDFAERHFLSLAGEFFKAGAAFVVVPIMFANPAVLTDRLIASLMVPALRKAFSACPGPIVFHHGANPLAERAALFRDLPNVAGFVLDERDSVRRAREELGGGPLLLGGPAGPNLRRRTPRSVAGAVAAALRENAADPRFALATTAADVPLDAEPAVLDAFMAAAAGREATVA